MLNIEGTKHEKITLVILAYIIGFTSGLIAFGISQDGNTISGQHYIIPAAIPLETANSLTTTVQSASVNSSPATTEVRTSGIASYESGRLYVTVNGTQILLSINRNLVGNHLRSEFSDQGIHIAIPYFTVSPDNQYVYFCEQHTTTDKCTNYIYDVANDVIHFVNNDGQKLQIINEEAKTAIWGNDDILTLSDYVSKSSDTPWQVINN